MNYIIAVRINIKDDISHHTYSKWCAFLCLQDDTIEFLPKWIEFSDWNYFSSEGFGPATPCIRDKDATTTQTRHRWETGFLNWLQSCFSDLLNSLNLPNSLNFLSN